jgi:serine/threonine-protein kinase
VSVNLFDQLQATLGGTYRLERELGGGGMSRVFLAHETALGRRVVVKVLLPELAAGVSVERFRREIQLAAQLQHPHIVPLLAAGEFEGLPYFTMPFISGESLRAKIARTGELPINETVRILRDVVSALAYAHENGVMHRDVKPDNVLMSGGVAVVTDFGVAKAVSASTSDRVASVTGLTSFGMALGTPNYMAPEQATGDPQIDHRADIYSVGVMAYEMLAARTPFAGRSTQAVLAAHIVEVPEPIERLRPSAPPALAALVTQCLAKRPADRPQSATEILHALDAIATPTGGIATTMVASPSPSEPPAPRAPRHRVVPWVAGAAVVGLTAIALLWRPAPEAARETAVPAPPPAVAPPSRSQAPDTEVPSPPPVNNEIRETAPAVAPEVPRRRTRTRPAPQPARPQETGPVERNAPAAATRPLAAPEPEPAESEPEPVSSAVPEPPSPSPQPVTPATPPSPPISATPPPAIQPPVPPPPRDPRPEVSAVVAAYAGAIEARSLDNLRRVYPGMTPVQQRGWEQFFETVRDIKAQLTLGGLDVTDGTAEAQVAGRYSYINTTTGRGESQPVSFQASLRREGGSWRIVQVR